MAILAAVALAVSGLELLAVARRYTRIFGPGIVPLAVLQLACAATLWLPVPVPPVAAFAATLAIAARSRGSYNGGSDSMLLVVLAALALARLGQPRAGMAYAAAQLTLSYVLAGLAKLRDEHWRRGTALPILVALPHYDVPPRLAALLARARMASFGMLAFELSFPLAFAWPWPFLAIGLAFHLTNAIAFGLNRFLWAWLAAYPAVLYITRS